MYQNAIWGPCTERAYRAEHQGSPVPEGSIPVLSFMAPRLSEFDLTDELERGRFYAVQEDEACNRETFKSQLVAASEGRAVLQVGGVEVTAQTAQMMLASANLSDVPLPGDNALTCFLPEGCGPGVPAGTIAGPAASVFSVPAWLAFVLLLSAMVGLARLIR